jgi:hypothetical protein
VNKGFFVSLLVIAAAAGLGYWLWSDTSLTPPSTLKLEEIIRTRPQIVPGEPETPERFSAGPFVEQIDLNSVFQPTGDELALQNLLAAVDDSPASTRLGKIRKVLHNLNAHQSSAIPALIEAIVDECITIPPSAESEFLPEPRSAEPEALPSPRFAATDKFPGAGEEASSPRSQLDLLRRQLGEVLARELAEVLSQMQPLKGIVPAPVDEGDEE